MHTTSDHKQNIMVGMRLSSCKNFTLLRSVIFTLSKLCAPVENLSCPCRSWGVVQRGQCSTASRSAWLPSSLPHPVHSYAGADLPCQHSHTVVKQSVEDLFLNPWLKYCVHAVIYVRTNYNVYTCVAVPLLPKMWNLEAFCDIGRSLPATQVRKNVSNGSVIFKDVYCKTGP